MALDSYGIFYDDLGHTREAESDLLVTDRETLSRTKKVTYGISDTIQNLANEPSLGLYRLQEHILKSVPELVDKKHEVQNLTQLVHGAHDDAEYAIKAVEGLHNITHFLNLQQFIENSISIHHKISLLTSQNPSESISSPPRIQSNQIGLHTHHDEAPKEEKSTHSSPQESVPQDVPQIENNVALTVQEKVSPQVNESDSPKIETPSEILQESTPPSSEPVKEELIPSNPSIIETFANDPSTTSESKPDISVPHDQPSMGSELASLDQPLVTEESNLESIDAGPAQPTSTGGSKKKKKKTKQQQEDFLAPKAF